MYLYIGVQNYMEEWLSNVTPCSNSLSGDPLRNGDAALGR